LPAAAKPKTLADALFAVQGAISKVAKDADNPFYHSRYASLPSIVEVVYPILQKNGLVLSQVMDQSVNGAAALRTVLLHPESGQIVEGTCPFPDGLNAQQMGSAVTYLRRYGLLSILGIVADSDDDGALASGTVGGRSTPQATEPLSVPTTPDGPAQGQPTTLPAAPSSGVGGSLVL